MAKYTERITVRIEPWMQKAIWKRTGQEAQVIRDLLTAGLIAQELEEVNDRLRKRIHNLEQGL